MYVCMYVMYVMYVCMYVSMYLCMYVCILYVCMYVCMHARMCVCMYVCRYVRMYLCMYVPMYLCIYVSMYLVMWTRKCAHAGAFRIFPYTYMNVFSVRHVRETSCWFLCVHKQSTLLLLLSWTEEDGWDEDWDSFLASCLRVPGLG